MRWTDGLIKVTKTYPKDADYCQGRTIVSTKGSNTYVEGSSKVADLKWGSRRGKTAVYGYCTLNGVARRRELAFRFRGYSTGPGRTTNVLDRLDSLRSRAKMVHRIDRKLYRDFLLDKDMYLVAYQKLRSNPGMMTEGINSETLDGFSAEKIDALVRKLANNQFQFTPGRKKEIPKANGKKRDITVGSPLDKIVQEVMRMVLEAIYEPSFLDVSHGFRPNRGCHTALRHIFTKFRSQT
jgi:hypothetical protein